MDDNQLTAFREINRACLIVLWLFIWALGCAISKSWISTLLAVFTGGIWSFYLVVEFIFNAYMHYQGIAP